MKASVFIKICGLTNIEDAEFAASCGADAVGFIGYPGSPRYISPNAVSDIIVDNEILKGLRRVAVFVDADIEDIRDYIDAGINTIQLHGNESAEFAEECSALFANRDCAFEVWRAIRPQAEDDILAFLDYPADKFLLDAFHKTAYGGTGERVDRKLAEFAAANLQAPLILAGGISPANCCEIADSIALFGLDVNSGIEKEPGIKDHNLMKELFEKLQH